MSPSRLPGTLSEWARDVGLSFGLALLASTALPGRAVGSDNDGPAVSKPAESRRPIEASSPKYKGAPPVVARLSLAMDAPTPVASMAEPAPSGPVADAGDDMVGLVGHRTTLSGSGRNEGEKVSYRWFQVAGPKVEKASQDRTYYTFTPTAIGVYRFGLIVASTSGDSAPAISEPDEVVVTVGTPPGSGPHSGYVSPAIEQAARAARALASDESLDQMVQVFEGIAERAPMYKAFGELSSEMTRRLDPLIPADLAARQMWSQAIFTPLTQHIMAEMRAVGLDLAQPQGGFQEMTPAQKDRLKAIFAQFSRELRSKTPTR